jgi:hypothetical protein
MDHTSDNELGLGLDSSTLGEFPLGVRAAAFWQNCLWVGGMPDYPSQLRFSTAGFPEQMPIERNLAIGTDKTGPIVAIRPIPRGLVVFKTGGVYIVIGSELQGRQVEVVVEGIGCAAPRAIELVPGAGLLFLDRSGPHVLIGALNDSGPTSVQSLVSGIRKTWRRSAGVLLQSAVSVYDPEHNEVWFHLPEGGNTVNTLGLVLHTTLGQWSVRTGYKISAFARYRGYTWVGSWDDEDETVAGVHLLTAASTSAFGETIESRYRTNYLVFDHHTQVLKAEIGIVALGGSSFSIEAANDRESLASQSDNDRPEKHPKHDRAVWGTAKWGAQYNWTDYEPAHVAVSIKNVAGHEVQFRFTSERIRLYQLSLLLPPGSATIAPHRPERRPS